MNLKLYRPCTEAEKEEDLKNSKYYKPTQLKSETKCSKITMNILQIDGMSCINSITVDEKTLWIKEWENLNFLQVFKEESKE